MNPKVGDYIIAKNKELWRIVDKHKDAITTYDIKSLSAETQWETDMGKYYTYKELKGVSLSYIRHLGTLLPEEKYNKTIKILYE